METRPKLEVAGTRYKCMVESDLPRELAVAFAEMDGRSQAEFFSFLAVIVERWDKPATFQWQSMFQEMDRDAKGVLGSMADYLNEAV